jgi:trehalose 6-phosphate synthase/phosphatase
MIRELIPEANIALFIHAPFPSSEIFRCLPKRKEILEGMLGANLVCFQTYSYSRHFISTCIRVCGFETTPAGVDANGTVTAVSYCPIGIDCERVIQDRCVAAIVHVRSVPAAELRFFRCIQQRRRCWTQG